MTAAEWGPRDARVLALPSACRRIGDHSETGADFSVNPKDGEALALLRGAPVLVK